MPPPPSAWLSAQCPVLGSFSPELGSAAGVQLSAVFRRVQSLRWLLGASAPSKPGPSTAWLPRHPHGRTRQCPVLGASSPELGSAAVFSSRRYSAAFSLFVGCSGRQYRVNQAPAPHGSPTPAWLSAQSVATDKEKKNQKKKKVVSSKK